MVWDTAKFLDDKLTVLSAGEAAYSLREAYKRIIGEYPSKESLAILLAQTALETGRWKSMHNGNWGNIKSRPTDGRYWTMYACDEIINGHRIVFKPPHDQCKFRAYLTPTDGAEDYIRFLGGARYSRALAQLKAGKVEGYTTALKSAGYFTADLTRYLVAMKALFHEFMFKMDSLLAWEPPKPPEPDPESNGDRRSEPILPPPPDIEIPEVVIKPPNPVKPEPTPPVEPTKKNTNVMKSVGVMAALSALYLIISSILQNCH